ncbi:InlB B-repeat-containing protein [Imhoffiella purpurea]|uniref:Bacterial repeat domain-containing protein n=1 Tax=Imhoffiella purpurea TaxID=1249627 RepID=W9VIU3_9GAMM|nr:M12 family metallo-peptidase [Imhoffiella purpurea]EXJ15977.1 hypothetical protein D779_0725 [Imhoffiella purpurea]
MSALNRLIGVFGLLAIGACVYASDSYMLFDPSSDASVSGAGHSDELMPAVLSDAVRYRAVDLSVGLAEPDVVVEGDRLELNLFENAVFEGLIDHTSLDRNGVRLIRGRLTDSDYGVFMLSVKDGVALGSIEIPEEGREFAFSKVRDGEGLLLWEVDPERKDVLESPDDAIVPDRDAGSDFDDASSSRISIDASARDFQSSNETIDVMILYTPAARVWADANVSGIEYAVSQAMARAQLAADDSDLGITFNLVYSAEVDYTESGDSGVDLRRITFHSDYDPWGYEGEPRYMDEVHAWRDAYGADLVVLLEKVEDVGGLGWLLSKAQGWPELGFHLSRIQQVHWTYTMIHEMGHNMGAHHHKEQLAGPGPGLYDYSAGWRWIGGDLGKYCSIMTYESGQYFSDGVTHSRVSLFSSPLLSYEGVTAGDTQDGDNRLTLLATKGAVSGYRDSTQNTYSLSVCSTGPTSVAISGQPAAYGGVTDYSVSGIASNTLIRLQAPAQSGNYLFSAWTGCDSSVAEVCTLTLSSNREAVAVFEAAAAYSLVVSKVGSGLITSSPAGIDCGSDCSERYTAGTPVTLTAAADDGYRFDGWSGPCTGSGSCTLTMRRDFTVLATFTATATSAYSETYYLANNPDVAKALNQGWIPSGWAHYQGFGKAEGRSVSMPAGYGDFNEGYYLARNPDVALAMRRGHLGTGWEHYSAVGRTEGRSYAAPDGYGDFNELYYLSNNPDVARAVSQGQLPTGWAHYQAFGSHEGRFYLAPGGYGDFSEEGYLANNSDVAILVRQGLIGTGWEHYDLIGRQEGRSYALPY